MYPPDAPELSCCTIVVAPENDPIIMLPKLLAPELSFFTRGGTFVEPRDDSALDDGGRREEGAFEQDRSRSGDAILFRDVSPSSRPSSMWCCRRL